MNPPLARLLPALAFLAGLLLAPASRAQGDFTALPEAHEAAHTLPRVKVEGNRFVFAETGETMVFRGVSASDPAWLVEEGQWGRSYFEAIASWNANVVRLPVHPSYWREVGGETVLRLLDEAVEWCGELGLYVIIDWHTIGNILTGVYHREMYVTSPDETYRFWHVIAHRYAGNPTVAMYELYNEPTNRNGRMGPLPWAEYTDFIEGIISMLYAIDDTKIPLVAGFNFAYTLTHVKEHPIRFPGVAYVTHPYPQKRSQPWEPKWEEDWGFVADTYPIVATEFGFMSAEGRGAHVPVIGDETYGEALIDFFEERGISWTAWVFDVRWTPNLIEDWDYTPSRQGRFFKQKMEALNP